MRTTVIAEPGSTHGGSLDAMLELVAKAAWAGCDVYKSQWVSDAAAMAARRHAPEYLDSYRLLQYPASWHGRLRNACHEAGLQYGCTVYLPQDVADLAPRVDLLKVSSFEAADAALLDLASTATTALGVPLYISLGMGADARTAGATYLHCVSSYPAPLDQLNLNEIGEGFSDHSRNIHVGAWAVCAGARVLETHFRLDDCDPLSRDYAVAFTPVELRDYVRLVRQAEQALGDGRPGAQECEQPMLRYRSRA